LNARPSDELEYLEAIVSFPQGVNTLQPLVLKIEDEFYQHLVEWEHWAGIDAFTGRYPINSSLTLLILAG
jgi:hypothetical protein